MAGSEPREQERNPVDRAQFCAGNGIPHLVRWSGINFQVGGVHTVIGCANHLIADMFPR